MIRIHSSLHKCLTLYYVRVMHTLYNRLLEGSEGFKHYASLQEAFYQNLNRHRIVAANNFAIDLARLGDDFRIVRFVRDPRDLIVSGYFYHRQGKEPWFRAASPTFEYWRPINGCVPGGMEPGLSYAEHLQKLSLEEGLIAEIQFRRFHLESLREWQADERIRLFRYEDILGNERAVFSEIFAFYELPRREALLGAGLAWRYSVRRRKRDRHVRNPEPGQWRAYFTPRVRSYFDTRYRDIVEDLGY